MKSKLFKITVAVEFDHEVDSVLLNELVATALRSSRRIPTGQAYVVVQSLLVRPLNATVPVPGSNLN